MVVIQCSGTPLRTLLTPFERSMRRNLKIIHQPPWVIVFPLGHGCKTNRSTDKLREMKLAHAFLRYLGRSIRLIISSWFSETSVFYTNSLRIFCEQRRKRGER